MASNGKPTTRKRIPKLSEKPEPGTGRHYTSYRAASGSARRQRFTKDYKESEQLYRRWIMEHYDDSVDIIVRNGSSLNGRLERTLPYIANAMIQHDKGRVRADGSPRTGGTISHHAADRSR